jgi:hypothetical protein
MKVKRPVGEGTMIANGRPETAKPRQGGGSEKEWPPW